MRIALLISLIFLFTKPVRAQCPDKNFLWHRIIYLRDTSDVPFEKQLSELLPYLNTVDKCGHGSDSTQQLLLQRVGMLYAFKKDFFTAIQYTRKAIAFAAVHKNNAAINPSHIISGYFNLIVLYDSLKMESKKSAAIDSCISIVLNLKKGYDYALNALAMKAKILFENGDYYGCINLTKLGESIVRENSGSIYYADYFEKESFPWKINSLIFLNKTNEAESELVNKIEQHQKQDNSNLIGTLYGLYGEINKDKGDAGKALFYFNKSFISNKKFGHFEGCAEALNNIGLVYSELLHQNKKALYYHFKALSFANNNEALNILDNVANIYVRSGNYDSAFYYFQKAFDKLGPGITEADLAKKYNTTGNGNITEYITGMVLDKADAYLKKYNAVHDIKALGQAIKTYQAADVYFDKIRATQAEIASKLFWRTNNRRLYEHAIEACFANKNINAGFYFFEKSRAVLLNDQLNQQKGMHENDIAKLAQSKKSILELESSLELTPSSAAKYLDIQRQLFSQKQAQELLLDTIKLKNPYGNKNSTDTSFVTLEYLKKNILSNQKSVLEIYTGDSAVYLLGITQSQEFFIQLDKHLYDSLTNTYIALIGNFNLLNKNFPKFVSTSHQLYTMLFGKMPAINSGSLIISPDGKSFPFEALVTNESPQQPEYLLSKLATSYTYSVKYLTNEFAVNTKNSNSILGVAPVQYKNYAGLATLAGSDNSLKNINNYFSDASNYVLEKATRNNFLQNFPSYKIIQLYTHAADSSTNNDPVIYFADSALYLSGLIADRKPITQLVVLSACETANGKLYEGEGIFSFNRGFAALGIPAAVSTLWQVDNESMYSITELFYKYLAQGLPTDIALQKAKLEFINSSNSKLKKLPYYWAGTILTGKADSIKASTGLPWKVIAAIAFALILIGILVRKFLFKKRSILATENKSS